MKSDRLVKTLQEFVTPPPPGAGSYPGTGPRPESMGQTDLQAWPHSELWVTRVRAGVRGSHSRPE